MRLEQLKHDQQKELEHVRHEIQSVYSRVSKIHEREFKVLPKAWLLLHETFGAAMNSVARLKQIPDFRSMDDDLFEGFLRESRLYENQKKRMRELSDTTERLNYYRRAIDLVDLDFAQEKHRLFQNYLIENSIFMTPDLQKSFSEVANDLGQGLVSYEVGRSITAPSDKLLTESYELITKVKDKAARVEAAVQARLHYEKA